MRGLMLAMQFLTCIPMPSLADYHDEELSRCAVWFPFVGLVIGMLLACALLANSPWISGLIVVLLWLGLTGGLHLDGAADLADALGAAHRDPVRFHAALKDPHIGAFGVMAIVALMLTKFAAAVTLSSNSETSVWALALIPAWARLGSIYWSQTLEPIAIGSGERFAWRVQNGVMQAWAVALILLTLMLTPFWFTCLALASLWLWRAFLQRWIGGMSGDCLGAGIEICEAVMLFALAVA